MNRRGILKGLLAAPVAAKHMGEKIASGLTSPGLAAGPPLFDGPGYGSVTAKRSGNAVVGRNDWLSEQVSVTKAHIAKLISRSIDDREAKNIAHHCRARAMQCLDPDLYAARSLSLSVKIHMQTQRNIDEHYTRAVAEQENALSHFMKQLAGVGNNRG